MPFITVNNIELYYEISGQGRFDGIAPPENLEATHQKIAQSEMRLYDGGHDFYNHDALAFQHIVHFLKGYELHYK